MEIKRKIWYGDTTRMLCVASHVTIPAQEMIIAAGGTVLPTRDDRWEIEIPSTPDTAAQILSCYSLGGHTLGIRLIAEPEYPWEENRSYSIAADLAGNLQYA